MKKYQLNIFIMRGIIFIFKVCLKSGDEIIFDSLLGIDKSNYLRGIEIMKKKGIIFIDKYHILSVLENDNINLWEHLKKWKKVF